MIGYAESRQCRQQRLIRYFGGGCRPCGHCDVCKGDNGKTDPLFERLREWRLEKSKEEGVPAFCILNDRALRAIAAQAPQTIEGLSDCYGLGAVKLSRYGVEILGVVSKEAKGPAPA